MTSEQEPARAPRNITITGTRSVTTESSTQLATLFERYLQPFAEPDATVYIGGAVGIDTAALDWLARHTQASLTVVVPCTVDDQPATARESIGQWQQRARLTDVVELRADELAAPAYHARNRWMVDRSDLVIGFPRGNQPTSGTWYTVNYAAEQHKPRLVVPV